MFTLTHGGEPSGGPPDGPVAAPVPVDTTVPVAAAVRADAPTPVAAAVPVDAPTPVAATVPVDAPTPVAATVPVDAPAPALLLVSPANSAGAPTPATVRYPPEGQFGDDTCDCEDSDWNPAESLTAREITALAAMDRAAHPADHADGWDTGRCDAGPTALGSRRAGLWLQDDEPDWPPGAEPMEALPGLMPRHLGTGGGFDAGGVADRVPPGPVLAGLTADKWAAGLSRASDDELAGLMIAWRRVASWAAAGELAAVVELSRRREAQVEAGADPHLAEHVSDEVAMALTLTSWAAGRLVDQAQGLARLPKTMAALATGAIDVPKALVILGELSGLEDVHASRVEAAVISRAAQWTTGELRRATRRQVIAADPAAARKQKEQAEKLARVERWAEGTGTAALAGRDLPPADVLAADAHLTAWAKRLKAAGLGGNLDQLRAQVYVVLLNGQHPETLLPTGAGDPGSPAGASNPSRLPGAAAEAEQANAELAGEGTCAGRPACCGASPTSTADSGAPLVSTAGYREGTSGTSPAAHKPPGSADSPPATWQRWTTGPAGPPLRGSVNLVLPLSTWLGWSSSPGEVAGFGPLDAADSRALAAVLARDPTTNWCVTVTASNGRALAHGCAKAAPAPPPTEHTGPSEGSSPRPPPMVCEWLAGVGLAWLATGECNHQRESPGYRPSRTLAHLIQIRQGTCTAPGCRHPATSCDFEHTIPYHQGGRTCECNAGPCCRRHHRAKQAHGWHLSQSRPGVFVWTTPHGRSYQTEPDPYPA